MKNNPLFLILSLVSSVHGNAQNSPVYKPVDVEMGFGIAFQQYNSYHSNDNGVVLNINPAYTFANRYRAGVQFEGVVYNMETTGSSMLTFDYYFISNATFRLYGGGGYGFSNSSFSGGCGLPSTSEYGQYVVTKGKTGVTLRVGFDFHHLNVRVAYNFAPSIYSTYISQGYPPSSSVYKNGYLGITVGVSIFGFKKSPTR